MIETREVPGLSNARRGLAEKLDDWRRRRNTPGAPRFGGPVSLRVAKATTCACAARVRTLIELGPEPLPYGHGTDEYERRRAAWHEHRAAIFDRLLRSDDDAAFAACVDIRRMPVPR